MAQSTAKQGIFETMEAASAAKASLGEPYKVYLVKRGNDSYNVVARSPTDACGLVAMHDGYAATVVEGNRENLVAKVSKMSPEQKAALLELLGGKPAASTKGKKKAS